MLAVNYQVIVATKQVSMSGTSASAPVFAALISLVNSRRLAQRKPPVGFINPTLYAVGNLKKFTDITVGENHCCSVKYSASNPLCCESGFTAAAGWDAVTGLGSVTLKNLLTMFGGGNAQRSENPTAAVRGNVQQSNTTVHRRFHINRI